MGCQIDKIDTTSKQQEQSPTETTSSLERLPNDKAGEVVKKAIEWAGGWEAWDKKKTLSYTKITQYFDSTGTMEREVKQLHQYQLQPQLKVNMTWEEEGDSYTIINNGEQAWKLKNGKEMKEQADVNHAWNSSFGSNYVMCMPFKLTDPGTVLAYEGLDTLDNGKVVHSIKTDYQEGAGSAAGMHTWWYYFEKDSYAPAANFLDYGNGFSYTQYEAFLEKDGIKLNQRRNSYRTNENRDLKYVRTVYMNEDVVFDKKIDAALFELPQ